MLKLTKSDIPWCDYSASPVTGCLHGCEWCYARGMVRRFGQPDVPGLHVLHEPDRSQLCGAAQPYPFGFEPTLYRYRLDAPRVRRPGRVFVGPMADLWGSWVPYSWQDAVLGACAEDPRHDYLFLTKNPMAYFRRRLAWDEWAWLGASATNARQARDGVWFTSESAESVSFLSCEPWLGGDNALHDVCEGPNGSRVSWLILGPLTGPKARTAAPVTRDAVLRLRDVCARAGVALFVKPSATAWGLTPEEIASMQAWPRPHPSER